MRWRSCIPILLLVGSSVSAQGVSPVIIDPAPPISVGVSYEAQATGAGGPLASNRNFPNFIGFLSNPLQNIDPRSLTQVVRSSAAPGYPPPPPSPDLDAQIYGPAISLALTDRLSVGLNQGGYAVAHIDRNDRRGPIRDRLRATVELSSAEPAKDSSTSAATLSTP